MTSKIVMKTTTKMSLSDRFANLRNNASTAAGGGSRLLRHNMLQQTSASVKSRRLAQQMERRPSVIAALKLKNKSLHTRLGNARNNGSHYSESEVPNIRSRLTLSNRLRGGRTLRGRLRGAANQSSILRGIKQGGVRGARKGISPLLKGRLGLTSNVQTRGRGNSNRGRRGGGGGRMKLNRATFAQTIQAKRRQRGIQQQQNRNQRNKTGRRPWGRGGRGRGSLQQTNVVSKQELDNDIDAYMAKTKGHLDAELDEYMSYANA